MKRILAATAVVSLAIAGTAYAQDEEMMKCDEETFSMMMEEVDAVSDEAMKEKAMMEMDMAKTAMEADNMDDCMMHLDMAEKAAMGEG